MHGGACIRERIIFGMARALMNMVSLYTMVGGGGLYPEVYDI